MPTPPSVPLSGVQRRYSFEIAKVFFATEAKAHDGFRQHYQWLAANNFQPVYDGMNTYLDQLVNTDVDTYTIVVDLIKDWECIRKDTFTFNGQIGSFGNVHYDPEEERENLAKLFSYYVPMMPLAMAHVHKLEAEQSAGRTNTARRIKSLH